MYVKLNLPVASTTTTQKSAKLEAQTITHGEVAIILFYSLSNFHNLDVVEMPAVIRTISTG
jgi:hypothetical protein